LVAVHEEELVDAVRGRREQVATQAEEVSVARVEARDRPAAHRLDFVCDRDARHRRPPEVVVGNEKRRRDAAQDADLMTHRPQGGPGRRFDLADQLEAAAHEPTLYTSDAVAASLPAPLRTSASQKMIDRPRRTTQPSATASSSTIGARKRRLRSMVKKSR